MLTGKQRKPLIASGVVSLKSAIAVSVLLSTVSIFLPLMFSRPVISVLSVLTIIIGTVYSFKPFYFSGRPFFDFLSNATDMDDSFRCGWSIAGEIFLP
jgi:4-hydroxybenzoate polyprenyltransferase